MKYCAHCGKEVMDEAIICPNCGCSLSEIRTSVEMTTRKVGNASIVFGIIGIVGAFLFALIGHIASVIGIIRGVIEYRATGKMSGLALSIVAEICCILSSIIGAATMAGMV